MDTDGSDSAVVRVSRTSPRDIGFRGLEVFLDDKFAVNLQFGETRDLRLPSGEHTLRVTNSLYTKRDSFTVNPGETMAFNVANIGGGLFGVLTVIGGTGPYKVHLERVK